MEREQIRKKIAEDLRGRPSRNPDSLIPDMTTQLGIPAEQVNVEVLQMTDHGHIVPIGQASLRLSAEGERYYFSSDREKVVGFFGKNWPHIMSNLIAALALFIALFGRH